MKRTRGLGILSAAAILGSGALYAAPQGPDNNPQAVGQPAGAPQHEMSGDRPPMPPMQQPPRQGMPRREQLKQAGATDAQIQALSEADYALRVKQIDLRAAVEKAELALERLMTGSDADEKAVLAAADTLSQARGELFKQELAGEWKRKQILGDELMRKLHDMRPPPERQGTRMRNNNGPTAGGPQDEGNRVPQGKNPRAATDEGSRPPPPMGE